MDLLMEVAESASVAAFLGALTAFLLVQLTDVRRERKTLQTLRGEIAVNGAHASRKLETAQGLEQRLHNENVIQPNVLRFSTTVLRDLMARVLGRLRADERQAIDALLHRMDGVDTLFAEASVLAKPQAETSTEGTKLGVPTEHRPLLVSKYSEIKVNLRVLIEMCDNYAAGKFREITTRSYTAEDYSDP